MPFKSKAQRRKFYAMESRGEISSKTLKHWEDATPKGKALPERVKSANLLKAYELTKAASIKDFISAVRGANAANVAKTFETKIMKHPIVRRGVKQTHGVPIHRDYVRDYVGDKLHPDYYLPDELLDRGKGREQLFDLLEGGRSAVHAEKVKTLKARLGLGASTLAVAAPIAAYSTKKASDDSVVPAVAGAAAGAMPLIQGIQSGALGRIDRDIPRTFKTLKDLHGALKPGDIVLTGRAGVGDPIKAAITAIGGDPKGYHVEIYRGNNKGHEVIHSHPAHGGAAVTTPHWNKGKGENVVLMRYKDDPRGLKAKKLLSAAEGRTDLQSALERTFGETAGVSRYDKARSIRAGLGSLLPKSVGDLLVRKGPAAGSAVCSSLLGQCSPVDLAPGVKPENILPHHVRRSPALKPIGKFSPKVGLGGRTAEALMAASPWALRGAAGLGLGYGAYRAAKALSDR